MKLGADFSSKHVGGGHAQPKYMVALERPRRHLAVLAHNRPLHPLRCPENQLKNSPDGVCVLSYVVYVRLCVTHYYCSCSIIGLPYVLSGV